MGFLVATEYESPKRIAVSIPDEERDLASPMVKWTRTEERRLLTRPSELELLGQEFAFLSTQDFAFSLLGRLVHGKRLDGWSGG